MKMLVRTIDKAWAGGFYDGEGCMTGSKKAGNCGVVLRNIEGYNGVMKRLRLIEQWAPIPGYEGLYEVSTHGRVQSLPRNTTKGKILKQSLSSGYLTVSLSKQGVETDFKVHQLVALAFLGPRPVGMQVRHLDGIKVNLYVGNLRYGTVSENQHDRVKHGSHHEANKTHCPQKHEYTLTNTSIDKYGGRHCKTCDRDRHRTFVSV